jgi:hypothetical protein
MKSVNFAWPLQRHRSNTRIKIRQNLSSYFGVWRVMTIPVSSFLAHCAKTHTISNFITSLQFIMRYLHNVHEMNACGACRICLCICFNTRNAVPDSDEIRYGYYANFVFPFPASSNSNKIDAQTFEVGKTLPIFNILAPFQPCFKQNPDDT